MTTNRDWVFFTKSGTFFQNLSKHRRVVSLLVIISILTAGPIGYHLVALNVPVQILQNAINESAIKVFNWHQTENELSIIWAAVVSVQSIGALIGCAIAPASVSYFGTKVTIMIVNNTILALTSLIFAVANSTYSAFLLIPARILSGVYIGIACVSLPIFIQEMAPKIIRGAVLCVVHIAVCIGSTLAALLSLHFMLGNNELWGLFLALPAVTAFVQLFGSWFIPDTPSHLLLCGQEYHAVHSIKFYYCIEFLSNTTAIEQYRALVTQIPEQISSRRAFANPSVRKGIVVGVVVSASQIFCGSVAAASYSTSMFTSVSFVETLIPYLPAFGSLLSALLTLPALLIVESYGRRFLFLATLAICTLCDCLFALFTILSRDGFVWSTMFAFTFLLFGIGYNLGVGPLAYFIPGEIVPPEAASVSLSYAVAVNWLSSLTTTFIYYPLNVAIGGWSYLLFALPSSFFLAFLYSNLPETKDLYGIQSDHVIQCIANGEDYGTFIAT